MSPIEAARILELPDSATPEQLEARFNELRTKLEDKISKAPTPGLKEKYRRSLEDVTKAFETLVLAADASTLPVLQRVEPGAVPAKPRAQPAFQPITDAPPPVRAASVPSKKKKGGSKEFVLVSLIAIVVLGGGGWWVVKTRAERAERIRIEAEEKARQLAAEKAEADEQLRRTAQLRIELATAKVSWEALENRLRDAERRTSEAKSELRGFRDGPAWKRAELSAMAHRHELFSTWLNQALARHPAKIARAKAEQLLSDKLVDEAAEAVAEMTQALEELQSYVPERAGWMLEGTSDVVIESTPSGIKFVYTDPYGRTTEGVTPAKLQGQPLSHLHDPKYDGDAGDTEILLGEFSIEPSVRFVRPGWKDVVETSRTSLDGAHFAAEFPEGALEISSDPAGLPFTITQHQDHGWTATGTTPAKVTGIPVGRVKALVERSGYGSSYQNIDIEAGKTVRTLELQIRSQDVTIAIAEPQAKIFVDRKFVGHGKATVKDLVPGEHALQVDLEGFLSFHAKFKATYGVTKTPPINYSIRELAVENVNCSPCRSSGVVDRVERCGYCGGRGWQQCGTCGDDGYEWVDVGLLAGGVEKRRCHACNGTKRRPCGFFGRDAQQCAGDGIARWRETCATCSGDGRVSKLQLSQ